MKKTIMEADHPLPAGDDQAPPPASDPKTLDHGDLDDLIYDRDAGISDL